jgi:hypothetical protein
VYASNIPIVVAMITGPSTSPRNPNAPIPPSRLTKISKPFNCVRPLKSAGRRKLSTRPMTPTPTAISVTPRPTLPVNSRKIATGSQTIPAPIGKSEKNAITTPQNTGALMPSSANVSPPSAPWSAATMNPAMMLAWMSSPA